MSSNTLEALTPTGSFRMAYSSTVFNQVLTFIPRAQFKGFVHMHQGDRYVKKLTTWNQFVALLYAQATGKDSLREIETGLALHEESWKHLGVQSVARSSLSYANNHRDYRIFEGLFYEVLSQCKTVTVEKKFSFDNPLYSLDATVIRLCLSLFDWASYTKTKGALKLHTLFNNRTQLPEVVVATDGRVGDNTAGKSMDLATRLNRGDILVADRAYVDYREWRKLNDVGIYFVSRVKSSMHIDVVGIHRQTTDSRVIADERILIGEHNGTEKYPDTLRRVRILDSTSGELREYVTNNMTLSAQDIALIYKQRWQIELFFKWIKQNLKIKTFLGISKNAVLTQIWVAMIYYLLLAYIKFQTKFSKSLLELTRMVREVLFVRRSFIDLLSLDSTTVVRFIEPPNPQLTLGL